MSASRATADHSPFAAISTPAFLVDRSRLQTNCDAMREKASASGVHFRPHLKTHKTIEIGRLQHGGGTGPITVSTVAEAEFFAAAGFRDITWAMPLAPAKLERCAELAKSIDRLSLLVDSFEALGALESFGSTYGVVFDAFLKVDCGYHRAGVDPDSRESVRLALALARSKAVRFHGLLTHAGHSYHAAEIEEIRRIAAEETAALTRFRARLAGEGLGELMRSVGSTPTTSVVERFADCDEVRPGNYVFFDAFQAAIGSCSFDQVAVSVLATVVGSYPERSSLIVDAGALALSKDRGADHLGEVSFGVICDLALRPLPMRLTALSQEHGTVRVDGPVPPVGTRVRIVPNHSCLTAAMFDRYHVHEGDRVVDEWRPVRGW